MLILKADAHHEVKRDADGMLVVLLKSRHPITGELGEAGAIVMSAHNALFLSEALRQETIIEISVKRKPRRKADVRKLEKPKLAEKLETK